VDPKGRDYANRKGEASRLVRAHRNNKGADKVSCVCFRVWSHAPLLSLSSHHQSLTVNVRQALRQLHEAAADDPSVARGEVKSEEYKFE
jgi:hypothetical protein